MTRIVAGTAKGRILQVPKSGTRPTSEKVREALFSRLVHRGYVEGCRVLDLYAGSGAIGLEAASRGAATVILVENNPAAAKIIHANAAATGLGVSIVKQSAASYLAALHGIEFDLAVLDPPYDVGEEELATVLGELAAHLVPDAMIVVERSKRSPEPTWPEGYVLDDQRTWGDTTVWTATALDSDE
ncbi:16S rRNA (guanine966-N2)-methyltransferase [Arcanobacterium wilhelmae]|uniref:16S rRNA (Guanine966-N2)-methyltransferase n=1 Tax=Arcanobacterium wilhelmae TaxID=1803177 RepID=A0ABT9ND33_9ACTO|nr:16S rRNA (guanine(966)-N(2))-methyltransferase RsmD [Arcanobacterium wilhelmae]MDP9801619.1 16S rRNA (guanine966-N2)-methyltransferase [Arcanobacterium wilhelmae]WFN90942.1 16S rRNA (guanine(966)-N(2))-methyltransferase RsmD [Arcanobacterium wilhelmae]